MLAVAWHALHQIWQKMMVCEQPAVSDAATLLPHGKVPHLNGSVVPIPPLTPRLADLARRFPNLAEPLGTFGALHGHMASVDLNKPVSMSFYQQRNEDLLARAAEHPLLKGLDAWLMHLRVGVLGPNIPAELGAHINRVFLELQTALMECDRLDRGQTIEVGCDYHAIGQSFDLRVLDKIGRTVRQIEVTSHDKPVAKLQQLNNSIAHIVAKSRQAAPGTQCEGAIALNWAPRCDPASILFELCKSLSQREKSEVRNEAGRRLHRIVLFSEQPGDCRVFAVLTRKPGPGYEWCCEQGPFVSTAVCKLESKANCRRTKQKKCKANSGRAKQKKREAHRHSGCIACLARS